MIINYLNLINIAGVPLKADAPLIIDPDTVLAFTVASQLLQPICRWYHQVSQVSSPVDHPELPECNLLDIRRQSSGPFAPEDTLGFFVPEAPDHDGIL